MAVEPVRAAKVVVVIAVKNGVPFVKEAVGSALRQGEVVDQVIVVDDGSTDDTVVSLAEFDDPRLVVMRNPGLGVSDARNAGAAASRAPWLLFLDADDQLIPDGIERLLRKSSPDRAAIYGDYQRIDEGGHVFGARGLVRRHRQKPSGDVLPALLAGNFIINGGILICGRDKFLHVGGFKSGLALCEDWLLWCRLATTGSMEYVPELVMNYRVHRGSVMMRRRRTYADFAPVMDAIFDDPSIAGNIRPSQLSVLRRNGENSLMTYCAQQAARVRAWREAGRLTAAAIEHSPPRIWWIVARVTGAALGF
jgi:glycosyltransferase involved in cell wall biosynthesis